LEAQKQIVDTYIQQDTGREVIGEFKDVESGKKNERPQLIAAIDQCKSRNATLLMAKLDRLSRNASFIFTLRDNNVKFQALDIPEANTLTIGIFATIAQHERELISQRTKDALKALKARGIKLVRPENLTLSARLKGVATIRQNAKTNKNNIQAAEMVKHLRKQRLSFTDIAYKLNRLGYKTSRNRDFQAMTVYRLFTKMLPQK
jgi:DNA invertase Pin-like site-specific DNA recombinase